MDVHARDRRLHARGRRRDRCRRCSSGWMPPCMQTSVAPRSQASQRAPRDLVEVEVVGLAAQVLAQLALGEGAELAAEVADVGVVDVAVDDVGDRIAARAPVRSASAARVTLRRSRRRAPRTAATISASASSCRGARLVERSTRELGARSRRRQRARAPQPRGNARRRAGRPVIARARSRPRRCASSTRWRSARRRSTRFRSRAYSPDRPPAARPASCRRAAVCGSSAIRCGHGASGLT